MTISRVGRILRAVYRFGREKNCDVGAYQSPINLISTDERGIAFITGTKMKIRQIVIENDIRSLTPEEIQHGHEHLSLAQINAALSYYDEHQSVIDQEIEASKRDVDRLRAENLKTTQQLPVLG